MKEKKKMKEKKTSKIIHWRRRVNSIQLTDINFRAACSIVW